MPDKLRLVKPEPFIIEPIIGDLLIAQEQFHDAFKVPVNPTVQKLYVKLIEEEHEEWIEDYYNMQANEFDELKELGDLLYVTCGLFHQCGFKEIKAEIYSKNTHYSDSISELVEKIAVGDTSSKTLRQLMYCIYGYAKGMDWDIDEAYRRVHGSNLSKLDDSGNPVLREDGKVLKGPNYKPPYLEDLTQGK